MMMTMDNRQRQLGYGLDHMPYSTPQFTDPWVRRATSASSQSQLYPTSSLGPSITLDTIASQPMGNVSLPYTTIALTAPISANEGRESPSPILYGQQDLLSASQDLLSAPRMSNSSSYGSNPSFCSAPSPTAQTYPSSTNSGFGTLAFGRAPQNNQYAHAQANERRLSQPSLASNNLVDSPVESQRQRQNSLIDLSRGITLPTHRDSFGDTLDAGRGMVAMSQDTTPRNIHGRSRGSDSSYGFPSTHSASSSISSTSTYPSYYGSMDSSVTDYSSTSELEPSMPQRRLPRPSGLLGGNVPPAPQSMMGQFSSKVSSSTQKKHKCKVCDKRFTRPSSLQTHMYSHTGEKPFCCEVEGCGRHFSVVSNLRRHRKVHNKDHQSESGGDMDAD